MHTCNHMYMNVIVCKHLVYQEEDARSVAYHHLKGHLAASGEHFVMFRTHAVVVSRNVLLVTPEAWCPKMSNLPLDLIRCSLSLGPYDINMSRIIHDCFHTWSWCAMVSPSIVNGQSIIIAVLKLSASTWFTTISIPIILVFSAVNIILLYFHSCVLI